MLGGVVDSQSRVAAEIVAPYFDEVLAAIRSGLRVERKRRPTKPSAAARERRLEEKKRRGTAKKLRRPPTDE